MYTLLTKKVIIEEKEHNVYGIAVTTAKENMEIHDISNDEGAVIKLVNECNSLELDAIHLQDVTLDFVTQAAMI